MLQSMGYKLRQTHCHCIAANTTPSSPSFSFNSEGRTRGAEMSGKGKRRSARLLKLEEQKNDDESTVCLLDPWQIIRNSISGSSARGKRKRNDELKQSQGEASCSHQPLPATNSNNLTSQSSVGQIIEYILDELEMRDRHELFAMPDDIQVTDYAERVNRPGDFATLRQKNKDGMYTALEQFENDVYMVFQKAMTVNSQDTVPFREAMSLLTQAKHVFMSLKNNQMYSESEIAAWRQRHLDQLQQPITPARREGGIGGPSRHAATTPAQRPPGMPRKKGAAEKKMQENAKNVGNAALDKVRQRGGKDTTGTPPGKKIRKGADDAGVAMQRRLTYTGDESGGDQAWRAMAMSALQGRHVAPQDLQEHTYRKSLQRFVRHAGFKARVAAELRSLECVARARHSPMPQYWNPGAGFFPLCYHHPMQPPSPGATDPAIQALPPSSADQAVAPMCKLETDELLKLFVLMGTPDAFLERAKQMSGDHKRKEDATTKGVRKVKAADDALTRATAAKAADHSKTRATAAKAADQERTGVVAKPADHARAAATAVEESLQKSSASEPAAGAYGPFAPPKLLLPGRLGFGQFASSSSQPFKVKPSTSNASGKKFS